MIAVTGGAGFIGRVLVRKLLGHGHKVRVLDNLHRGDAQSLDPRADFRRVDIRDAAQLRKNLAGAEVVFHLAAQSNVLGAVSNADYSISTNVLGTYNVLNCARDLGVARVVFSSSREVYGDVSVLPVSEQTEINPKNVYGMTKAAGEFFCEEFARSGLNVVTVRFSNVIGPGDTGRVLPLFVARALSGEPLVIYGSGKILDFVSVEDATNGLIAAANRGSRGVAYNIGSGTGTTLEELAAAILRLSNSNSAIESAPGREIEVDRFIADISLAKRELFYRATTNLESSIAEAIEHSRVGSLAALSAHLNRDTPPIVETTATPGRIGVETVCGV